MKREDILVAVVDGQGGGMGAQLVRMLAPQLPADCELLAVGTNVLATNAMIKAGAQLGYIDEEKIICETAASAFRAGCRRG